MEFSIVNNPNSIKYLVNLSNNSGYFMISTYTNYPTDMAIHINEEHRGKRLSYKMIKFLLDQTRDIFSPKDKVYIDTEASEFKFWSSKLGMENTYDETGYEYGITFDKLRRNIRRLSGYNSGTFSHE